MDAKLQTGGVGLFRSARLLLVAAACSSWLASGSPATESAQKAADGLQPKAQFQEGKHFQRMPTPLNVGGAPGDRNVMLFASFGCGSCRYYEEVLRTWVSNQGNTTLRSYPLDLGRGALEVRAFALLEQIPEGAIPSNRFFFYSQRDGSGQFVPIYRDESSLREAFRRIGIDAAKFDAIDQSFGLQMYLRRAGEYVRMAQVLSVPTVIVAGKYVARREHLTALPQTADAAALVEHLLTLSAD